MSNYMSRFDTFFKTPEEETEEKQETTQEAKPQIKIAKVQSIEDTDRPIADLKNGCAVIADTTSLKEMERVRAYERLTGACIYGNMQMATIAPQIFLLTPKTFQVDDDADKEITIDSESLQNGLNASKQEEK